MFVIEEAAEALEVAAERVDVDALDGTRAVRLVETLARVERVVAGARTVVTRRVEETRAWKRTGHRTMADWLAATTGTTLGDAIGSIETARSLPELPATEAAFRSGDISETQARAVSAAAVEDTQAERSLLATARIATVKTLRQRSRAVIAAATAEDDERERDDAFAADALVALADPGERTPVGAQLTVDAGRLRYEPDASGESCSVAGIRGIEAGSGLDRSAASQCANAGPRPCRRPTHPKEAERARAPRLWASADRIEVRGPAGQCRRREPVVRTATR